MGYKYMMADYCWLLKENLPRRNEMKENAITKKF